MTDQTYLRRWQRAAYQALGEFLKADLPAVTWTIATSGALVGDVDSLTSTPAEQRAAFDAWARHLDADVWPERTDSNRVTRLHAGFAWSKNPDVRGAIRADIYPPLDDEAGEPS
ncbi:hypothetical protein OG342_07010 [Streptomyces bobili]|uniref:hypothetical protein n=1 Tax=Streptomyces bobili TaxID=67280 RepID=UPI0022574166|nr:hypothetical protein [Streptomyces bobili]MCX5522613.1 hypothetical protein [Streptomyces bobili]